MLLALFLGTLVSTFVLAAVLWWKVYRSEEKRLARRISRLAFGDKLAFGAAVLRDPRVPAVSRVVALVLVLYLASPIDLLPDFLPLVGFLDDLLVVMVAAGLILRTAPQYVLEEHLERYEARGRGARLEGVP